MEYRKIGKWGVKLSVIGLGSYLTIGYKNDKKTTQGQLSNHWLQE
jgi:aryl-alcohol dehydrogenase-like predicted oxidoreductase